MKLIFVLSFALLGTASFAVCPNLVGHFDCKSHFIGMPDYELEIEQANDAAGNTVYDIVRRELPDGEAASTQYITDGLLYDVVDKEGNIFQLKSSCVEEGFRAMLEGEREDLGHLTLESTYSFDRRGRLVIKNDATTERRGDVNYEDRCDRN